MGVTRQIFQDLWRPAERRFGINHPFDLPQFTQPGVELVDLGQARQLSGICELIVFTRFTQIRDKFAAKEPAQDFDREEESFATGYPLSAVGG
jgi:hypothetical protein